MPEVVSPGRSSRCPAEVSRDSSISTGASRSAARPAGTLMKKHEGRERQRVARDHPLQAGQAYVQRVPDSGQGHVHHSGVEHDHEQPGRDGGERPPLLVLRGDQPSGEPVTGDGEGVLQTTHRVTLRGRLSSGISYGQPAPGAGASAVSTWPVRGPANMLPGPFHTVAVINSVLRPGPPSAHAVKLDRLHHFATFANAYTPLVRHVPIPDGVLSVEANAVGHAVAELSPHAPV